MRITLVVEYSGRVRWQQSGPWARVICSALLRQGHEVCVVADCIADTGHFAGASVEQFRPARKRLQRAPARFCRWAMERLTAPSISLSSVVPAALWCPLDADWRREVRDLASIRNPATLAMEAAHRLWLPSLAHSQRRAEAMAQHNGLARARLGALQDHRGVVGLGFCSAIDPSALNVAELRHRVRRALGIDDDAFVACASAAHAGHAGLRDMLAGWRQFARADGSILLLMARKSALLDRIVGSLDMRSCVRILGQTERPELPLAAADAAIAWDAAPWSTGRFLSDALVMQRPVLAHRQCVGAELIERYGGGLLLESEHWPHALSQLRNHRSPPARVDHLSPIALGERIERALLACPR
ncbi:MAG: hypothetical protein KJZ65_09225 [Phycisphaerales bacterium]|nr:hypothetical protein [Phycisphaerales bacterium]